jgi:hypothetical protein
MSGIAPATMPGAVVYTSSPSATVWQAGRVDVVARGSDNALWLSACVGYACDGPWSLGGQLDGNPTAVSASPGTMHLFVRGLNGGLWMKVWTGSQWLPSLTDWTALDNGNSFTGTPTAVTIGSQIVLYARSPSGHLLRGVYYTDPALNYWTGFFDVGGTTITFR